MLKQLKRTISRYKMKDEDLIKTKSCEEIVKLFENNCKSISED